ncbi:3-keto-5-aminohexanoate cleavage protein [Mesorhizobium shangrilense]|uniref:3-keto-5-aminohexanoate cleavage protein n=1 Tax=Mesorhizobium shangrilense TaxID=460060 RepID=A0ABV2DLI2_9HYPH
MLAVADAGATAAHVHVRDVHMTEGSRETVLYAQVLERVRAQNTDIIINFTAGMGGDLIIGAEKSPDTGRRHRPRRSGRAACSC